VILIFPGASSLSERFFLARDEERLANGVCYEATPVAFLDEAFEIGADLVGKSNVSS
jgi:hypothetical protein